MWYHGLYCCSVWGRCVVFENSIDTIEILRWWKAMMSVFVLSPLLSGWTRSRLLQCACRSWKPCLSSTNRVLSTETLRVTPSFSLMMAVYVCFLFFCKTWSTRNISIVFSNNLVKGLFIVTSLKISLKSVENVSSCSIDCFFRERLKVSHVGNVTNP